MRNWKNILGTSLAIVAMMAPLMAQSETTLEDGRVKGRVPPPKPLKLVGDHWTPYDAPATPEGVNVHVIQKGDTLWDLAGEYYGDNYLWPVIWDSNRYITYSHWIYPGDPLVVPPNPTVVGEDGIETAQAYEPAPEQAPVQAAPQQMAQAPAPVIPSGPMLIPAAEQQEMICSAQLARSFDPSPLAVAGFEIEEKELHATGDILYLSAGRDMGLEAGTEYMIVREGGDLDHPETGKFHAVWIQRLGKVRVLAVQDDSAMAEVLISCDGIERGDTLTPARNTPIPMVERVTLAALASLGQGRLNGTVIVGEHPEATIAGSGDVVGIDLPNSAGLTAGDRVLFWRERDGFGPRRVTAQGVVLSTDGGGSTVKVLEAIEEITIGMRAQIM